MFKKFTPAAVRDPDGAGGPEVISCWVVSCME